MAVSDQTASPRNATFAGHQTFPVRAGWLKKGIDAIAEPEGDPGFFTRPDALVELGVGKNMVQSVRHWLLAFRAADEKRDSRSRELEATPLGAQLFGSASRDGWDPFLEDPASLWLLHWQVASPGSIAFSWVWAFNHLREYEFSKESLADSILSGAQTRVSKLPSRETVERDVECLLHTYVEPSTGADEELDCPLRSLGLIRPTFGRHFRFQTGAKPLPAPVFFFALCSFWDRQHRQADSLSVHRITYDEGSPGMVFKLDEESVLAYLDALGAASDGKLVFEDTPLVREVTREERVNPITFLERYFNSREGG